MKKSMVWNFFEKVEQNGQKWVVCTICNNHYRCFGGTSNMIQHLTRRHANEVLLSEVQDRPTQVKEQVEEQVIETNDLSDLITFETDTHNDSVTVQSTPSPSKRIFIKPSQKFLKKRFLNTSLPNRSPMYSPYKAAATPQKTDNEFELFARYMVSQLQVLPLEEALTVQEAIQSIITKSRLRALQKGKLKIIDQDEASGMGSHQDMMSENEVHIVNCFSEEKDNTDEAGQSVVDT